MRSLLLALTLFFGAQSAPGSTIALRQDGWAPGGPLHLTFAGIDNDGDGALVLAELTAFAADWLTPDGLITSWDLAGIEPDGFYFQDAGNLLFFARNSAFSLVATAFEGEALSSVFDEFLFPVSSSIGPIAEVPEPGTLWLAGVLLSLLVAQRDRPSRGR